MARWWNRLQSAVYTRLHWINEWYARFGRTPPGEIPLPPLADAARPLEAARVAIVTAGGVHLRSQEPFDMADGDGDASVRLLPADAAVGDLTITHDYYDHQAADRDINCVYPIERLRELVSQGEVGSLAPLHVGMMGHLYGAQWERMVRDGAPRIAALMQRDAVDLVLATPG
jgi:D-proline reductase (dithiol) PrdB